MIESERFDRLSELPDEVLSHLLSFVQSKSGIQTILLSKSLTHLWNTGSSLNFSPCFFKPRKSFHRFVLTTLDRRRNDPNVDTVRFHSNRSVDPSTTGSILRYVSSNRIDHLVLGCDYSFRVEFPFPAELLLCRNLRSLTLRCCEFRIPIHLPNLNSLNMEHCRFSHSGNDCFDLLAYFPNLKNLRMFFCDSIGFKLFRISGPNLLNLKIGYGWMSAGCKVEISLPDLTLFSSKHSVFMELAAISLPSLKSAVIYDVVGYSILQKDVIRFLKLFRALHKARFVRLSYDIIKKLKKEFAPEKVSLFPQLGKVVEEARDSFEDGMYELDAHGVKSLTEILQEINETMKNQRSLCNS